jgi:hypothetical protein
MALCYWKKTAEKLEGKENGGMLQEKKMQENCQEKIRGACCREKMVGQLQRLLYWQAENGGKLQGKINIVKIL